MGNDNRRLRIDGDELLDSMTPMRDNPFTAYLDLETGRVAWVPIPGSSADLETDDEESNIVDEHPGRFAEIPPVDSSEEYELMVHFADEVDEPDVREKLALALDGAGAFRRFRDVVSRYPDLSSRWASFRHRELAEIAGKWLNSIGVEPDLIYRAREPQRSPARAEKRCAAIALRELLLLGAPDGKTELIDGRVTRVVRASSPSEARHIFKTVAREIYESQGIAWRTRFIEGVNTVELGGYQLSVERAVVTLEVQIDHEVWRKFYG
jgi:hypothetical protein